MKKEQPECKVDQYGNKAWLLNGKYHREDGPAVEWSDGYKGWCLNGKYHREDGPAREWPDGNRQWFLNDKEVHPETLVDLHLSRGTFCCYDPETDTLHFDENNEKRTARM